MRALAVGFATGAALLQHAPALPDTPAIVAYAVAGLATLLAAARWRRAEHDRERQRLSHTWQSARAWPLGSVVNRFVFARDGPHGDRLRGRCLLLVLTLAGATLTGYDWAAWRAQQRLAVALPVQLEDRPLRVTGRIDGIPTNGNEGARFELRVDRVDTGGQMLSGRSPTTGTTNGAQTFPRRLRLSWSATMRGRPRTRVPGVAPGQCWTMSVKLRRPRDFANFDLPSVESALLQRDIRATGFVLTHPAPQRQPASFCATDTASLKIAIDRLRSRVAARIGTVLGDRPQAGVIAALAVGEQQAITAMDRERFTRTGTNHLVAISGLHVGLVSGMAAWLASRLWRAGARIMRLGRSMSWVQWTVSRGAATAPRQTGRPSRFAGAVGNVPLNVVSSAAGMVACIAYVALAGCGIPAQRAGWMLAAIFTSRLSGRATPPSFVLAWALMWVVCIDPWAVAAAGFWLSFGAVGAILYATSARGRPVEGDGDGNGHENDRGNEIRQMPQPFAVLSEAHDRRPEWWRWRRAERRPSGPLRRAWRRRMPLWRTRIGNAWHVQGAVTVGLIPASAVWFGQIPVLGAAANLLAIPWVSMLVVPPVLAGVVLPAPLDAGCFIAAQTLMAWLSAILDVLAAPSWAVWRRGDPGLWPLMSALVGLALWLGPAGLPLRPLVPLLWLPLLLARPLPPAEGEFEMTFLDIGQGNAVLVRTRRHVLLFDTGPPLGRTDAGARVIVPALRRQGIDKLDTLIVSHAHDDHYGGAAAVMKGVAVERFLASLPTVHPLWRDARETVPRRDICRSGLSWQWDGVTFTTLWPRDPASRALPNAMSCAVRISNGVHAALLAADLEAPQEAALLRAPADVAYGGTGTGTGTGTLGTGFLGPGPVIAANILLVPHHGSKTSSSAAFLDAVAPVFAIYQTGYRNRYGHPHPLVVARYAARGVTTFRSDRDGAVRIRTRAARLEVEAARRERRRYWMAPWIDGAAAGRRMEMGKQGK